MLHAEDAENFTLGQDLVKDMDLVRLPARL